MILFGTNYKSFPFTLLRELESRGKEGKGGRKEETHIYWALMTGTWMGILAVSQVRFVLFIPSYRWENWGLGKLSGTSLLSPAKTCVLPFKWQEYVNEGWERELCPGLRIKDEIHILNWRWISEIIPCVTTGTPHTKL